MQCCSGGCVPMARRLVLVVKCVGLMLALPIATRVVLFLGRDLFCVR